MNGGQNYGLTMNMKLCFVLAYIRMSPMLYKWSEYNNGKPMDVEILQIISPFMR